MSPSNSFSPVLFKNDIDVIGISSWRKYVKCEFSIGIIFGSSTTSVFPFLERKRSYVTLELICDVGESVLNVDLNSYGSCIAIG